MLRVLFLIFMFQSLITQAQQLPIFTQYRENHGYINPASISSDYMTYYHNLSFGATYRLQWAGFENSPRTQTLHGEYLFTGNAVGLLAGGYIINDETHPTALTGVIGRIAGIVTDDPMYGGLSLGLSFGAMQYRADLIGQRGGDANVVDPLTQVNVRQFFPDVGFGLFAYKKIDQGFFERDNIYAGFSVPQLFGLDFTLPTSEGEFNVKRVQHYFFVAGWYKYISESSFIEPSAWVKYVPNTPLKVDFIVRGQISDLLFAGVGGSTAKEIHFECGVLVGDNLGWSNQQIKIGYGYDYALFDTGYAHLFGPTHEINVAWMIDTEGQN